MNNYLLQLLKEVKTLIIPGLGALTVTNESTGEILFMPYLKFDDGTLAKHIASKENIELNDATNLISKFVREVTLELDKGNSYDMYQFGRFVKVDGEIAFEAWTPANSGSLESLSTEQAKTEIPSEKVELQEEEGILPKIETLSGNDEELKEQPEIEKVVPPAELPKTEFSSDKDQKLKEQAAAEEPKIVVGNLKVEEAKIIPPVVEKPVSKIPAEKPLAAKKEKEKKEALVKAPKVPGGKKKTSVFAYILWGFLVLVLGSGTFIAIKFDSLKKDFPILADLAGENDDVAKGSEDVKQLEDEPDVNIDSETESEPVPEDQVQLVEDQLPEAKVAKEPKKAAVTSKKETPVPKPKTAVTVNEKPVKKTQNTGSSSAAFDGSKRFHVIAGSFGSEGNANKLAGKLQSQGFSEASVTINNGMYRVSVKGFNTLNEATAEAANIQSSVPGAWVLKM